jgi:hypothetical protein
MTMTSVGRSLVVPVIVATSILSGCSHTRPIAEPEVLNVPQGLTLPQVEVGIIAGILGAEETPRELTNAQAITDSALRAGFGRRYRSVASKGGSGMWFIESRDPKNSVVYAGFQKDTHFLRVEVKYDQKTVTTKIVGSENLDQRDGQIHKAANEWFSLLKSRIRISLGQISMGG